MPMPGTKTDTVKVASVAGEVKPLRRAGAIPGVVILYASGLNGPGSGELSSVGNGTMLRWRAPGSTQPGSAVPATADGQYVLEDGLDRGKFVRVRVNAAYLTGSPVSRAVRLDDVYNNAVAHADVTDAEAAAGDVSSWSVDLVNQGSGPAGQLVAWVDPAVADIEISDDGVSWGSPTTEPAGLALGDLAAGASTTLHIRRTITAGAGSDPAVLNDIRLRFDAF